MESFMSNAVPAHNVSFSNRRCPDVVQSPTQVKTQTRGSRLASFDQVSALKTSMHFGKGFGSAKSGWSNSIWANASQADAFTDGPGDAAFPTDSSLQSSEPDPPFDGKTGSGSLLSTSESDGWNGRSRLPWPTAVNNNSPVLSRTNSHNISPIRQRNSDQSSSHISDLNGRNLPLSSNNRPSFGQMADQPCHSLNLSSVSSLPLQGSKMSSNPAFNHLGSSEEPHPTIPNITSFGNDAFGSSTPSTKHYANSALNSSTRNGTVFTPTSSSRTNSNMQNGTYFRTSALPVKSNFSHHTASRAFLQPFHSTDASLDENLQNMEDQTVRRDENQASEMERPNVHGTEQLSLRPRPSHRPNLSSQMSYDTVVEQFKFQTVSDDRLSSSEIPTMADLSLENGFQYPPAYQRGISFGHRGSSPNIHESRRDPSSPVHSITSTPPMAPRSVRASSGSSFPGRATHAHFALLDRKLRGNQPFQQEHQFLQPNPLQMHSAQQYETPYQARMQMNPLARPYAMPHYPAYSNVQPAPPQNARYGRGGQESSQVVRSPLLEEFRAHLKTNRRWELKEIYNHVVEFSGDQHGSRFIQQKLETANSDEKDQIFGEIQPNAIQLMTDLFGNYVIQKIFEHGNQTQKKMLANQMKGHVMTLSTQMYGCRVVQKALEHVLVDQQASLVKELEHHVLKCVKDQNGNHVIQKAIERVPAQHIQFIINDFQEQVQRLATHPYGCRVIQRMLEHCEEYARESILSELHGCVATLIIDQFGNYVIQHVIKNGDEKDRSRIISVVISQLSMYSKHKFASNVVEKSIEFAEPGQKAELLKLLTAAGDKEESLALALVRDQYGNYVIQKVLGHLRGAEREVLVEQIRAHLVHLKKFNYGKQVAAIEKLIYSTDMDSNPSASSQSSSLPSTNASTVEGPTGGSHLANNSDSEHTVTSTPAMPAPHEVN